MASSSDVFALRKAGKIDEAYELSLVLLNEEPYDEWNIKAVVYCLCDQIKRAVLQKDYKSAQGFVAQIDALEINEYDEILNKSIRNAKLLADPDKENIVRAKQLSFEGKDIEAFPLYVKAIESYPDDIELLRNFGWTMYKVWKSAIENHQRNEINYFLSHYKLIEQKLDDERLIQGFYYLEELSDESRQIIRDAKRSSKEGNHYEALQLFRIAIKSFPEDADLNEQFAWELYREGKVIFEEEKPNILRARQLLAEYIKLKNERPSQLHSIFLRMADKISDADEFNFIAFIKLWDLQYLRDEDFQQFQKDGKTYSSIAEKVIQHCSKTINDKHLNSDVDFFMPFIDDAIKRFPENIWLTYYKAKLFHLVGRNEDAIQFLIPVIKEKVGEFWVWSLLGELLHSSDKNKSFSAYCKALLCKGDESFLANVRVRFSELLIQKRLWNEAKYEIESVVKIKSVEGHKVPGVLHQFLVMDEIKNAIAVKSNENLYSSNKQLAEELVFSSILWLDAVIGEQYHLPEKPDKPRRNIYIKFPNEIIDISISDRKYNISNTYSVGEAVKIKGEYDKEQVFNLFLLENRPVVEKWDIFEWQRGNISYVLKNDENKITGYRVSAIFNFEIIEGIVDLDKCDELEPYEEGSPVFVKYFIKHKPSSRFFKSNDIKIKIVTLKKREKFLKWDVFPDDVAIVDHVNDEKGVAHFIVSKEVDGIVHLNQIKGNIEVGTRLLVKLRKVEKGVNSYYSILKCHITNREPTKEVLVHFSGIVKLSGSVGFVRDVFLDIPFIKEFEINQGDFISAMAILNYNRKKSTWGWKAIKMLEHNKGGYKSSWDDDEQDEDDNTDVSCEKTKKQGEDNPDEIPQ